MDREVLIEQIRNLIDQGCEPRIHISDETSIDELRLMRARFEVQLEQRNRQIITNQFVLCSYYALQLVYDRMRQMDLNEEETVTLNVIRRLLTERYRDK